MSKPEEEAPRGDLLDDSSYLEDTSLSDNSDGEIPQIISPRTLQEQSSLLDPPTSKDELFDQVLNLYRESQQQIKQININNQILLTNQQEVINELKAQNKTLGKELLKEQSWRQVINQKINNLAANFRKWSKNDKWAETDNTEPSLNKTAAVVPNKDENTPTIGDLHKVLHSDMCRFNAGLHTIAQHQIRLGSELINLKHTTDKSQTLMTQQIDSLDKKVQQGLRKNNINLICLRRNLLAATQENKRSIQNCKAQLDQTDRNLKLIQENTTESLSKLKDLQSVNTKMEQNITAIKEQMTPLHQQKTNTTKIKQTQNSSTPISNSDHPRAAGDFLEHPLNSAGSEQLNTATNNLKRKLYQLNESNKIREKTQPGLSRSVPKPLPKEQALANELVSSGNSKKLPLVNTKNYSNKTKEVSSNAQNTNNTPRSTSTNTSTTPVLYFNVPENCPSSTFHRQSGLGEHISQQDWTLAYIKPGRREGTQIWEVILPTVIANIALRQAFFFIGDSRIGCQRKLRFLRCTRCQQIDSHTTNQCRAPPTCPNCGFAHEKQHCTSDILFCVNCWSSNYYKNTTYSLNHSAADPGCMAFTAYKKNKAQMYNSFAN